MCSLRFPVTDDRHLHYVGEAVSAQTMNGQEMIRKDIEFHLDESRCVFWKYDDAWSRMKCLEWLDAGLWYHLMLRKEELEQDSSALDEAIQRLGRGIY